jgi:hypothetical protein
MSCIWDLGAGRRCKTPLTCMVAVLVVEMWSSCHVVVIRHPYVHTTNGMTTFWDKLDALHG